MLFRSGDGDGGLDFMESRIRSMRKGRRFSLGKKERRFLKAIQENDLKYVKSEIEDYDRSEERRVGKECRSWWSQYH